MSQLAKQTTMVGGEAVPFRVVRSPARKKTIALQVQPDGRIVVRAPAHTPVTRIREILQRKTAWLSVRRRIALANTVPTHSRKEFVAGESFLLHGQHRRLKFVSRHGPVIAVASGRSLVVFAPTRKPPTNRNTREALSLCFRKEAATTFAQRLVRFLPKLGVEEAPRLMIADQTRRWGSCNLRGELRLNWRLVGAPLSLIDYVIVHELCHLHWRDHSPRFWREIRRVLPDYAAREQALARIGPELIF
jgi:predicted metal-dependent hydrolase